jgi:hypothetical protein
MLVPLKGSPVPDVLNIVLNMSKIFIEGKDEKN